MDAHRVEVFDRADDDALVLVVAHHFHLVFLPAEQAFLDEDLVHRRGVEAGLGHAVVLFAVVGDAAARAAQGVGRTDDDGEFAADERDRLAGFLEGLDHARARDVEADFQHQLLELLAIFAALDGVFLRADQFHAVLGEDAGAGELEGKVQRGLTSERREEGVGLLLGDDAFHGFDRERFHVGDVRGLRIGHDRGRIGVHQDDAVTFLAEGLARLGAGIIELTGLADDDRTRADDEDGTDIGPLRHSVPRTVSDPWKGGQEGTAHIYGKALARAGRDGIHRGVDIIRISGIRSFGHHGALPEEKRLGQRFTVSVDLEVDTRPAAAADDLKLTVDYAEVIRTVEGQLTGKPVYLIETLAQQIAARILGTFPVVKAVTVEVNKPFAPVAADFEAISVKIRRERV